MRVLILEDDDELRGALARRLRSTGFAVDAVSELAIAEETVAVNDYDCLVLDRAVPGGDALHLVSRLRGGGFTTPALFLTARDSVADRIDGFEAGGDDYLVKPFAMDELVVRVRSLCRRRFTMSPAILEVGAIVIDQARAEVRCDGVLMPLTNKEMCVLSLLAGRSGEVVTRSDLIEHCWDELTDPMSNTVDVHVASLRRKLGEALHIVTVRGRGYRMEPVGS